MTARAIDKVKDCETMMDVRKGVNALDDILVPLLVERSGYMTQAAKVKNDENLVYDQDRIEAIVERVRPQAEAEGGNADLIPMMERLAQAIELQTGSMSDIRSHTRDTADVLMRVTRGGIELQLSPIGLRLLTILMRESPRVVGRQEIEREIWGNSLPDSDTLRSHLYNLRKVIDKPFDKPLLHTVQSAGYRIADIG